jgi:surface antigen
MFSKPNADPDITGSLGPQGTHSDRADGVAVSAADLAYARAAAVDVLAHSPKGNSVPWLNPQTGGGGNITPLATSYSEGGLPCRDFLASYAHGGSQAWLQGSACRTARGEWQVKSLKPLKSS